MGSKAIQSHLWGQRPQDWADIQEATGMPGYDYVAGLSQIRSAGTLLDVGCGSGIFCGMAKDLRLTVTGLDATENFIEQARSRYPDCTFVEGEMEELPFEDESFDVVTGFNSFQYAANVGNALAEARRVLKPGGTLTATVWGAREDCEAAVYLKAVGSMLPPPPPGAPGPYALSEPDVLKNLLTDSGFKDIIVTDVPGAWEYPNLETAMRGMLSAGPPARAIENSGYEQVYNAVRTAVMPFVKADGSVMLKNTYRIAVATK
ncbi:class I SAM-dependent methyltransferase [Mucilaginibacter ginkgonis]|uniref:Class I SAM-dependent methyltransferase n=1 Tax=Mucilaginibacter ginkgonis TaxID=2682091 RepID=A0A6I4HVR2_9SPHI|nr:class I SAM-dependent methyltransferase [Mucilaginibacter ginkgonis]QQL50998.1 class I SAM-dependent methyltransferase [Mucilaginibacter ginkgonis]